MNSSQITSLNILEEIATANPTISEFSFSTLDPAPLLQDRAVLSGIDKQVAEEALMLRREMNLPFWDGALLSCSNHAELPKGILEGASFHQPLAGKSTHINSIEVKADHLLKLCIEASKANRMLAVNSTLKSSDGSKSHLALIDFHVAFSTNNTSIIKFLLSQLGLSGWLLRSGKSYHFYGTHLLKNDEFTSFLGNLLLYSPIVDRSWVAHQLIEGCCTLRISSRPDYGHSPILVESINL